MNVTKMFSVMDCFSVQVDFHSVYCNDLSPVAAGQEKMYGTLWKMLGSNFNPAGFIHTESLSHRMRFAF